MKTVKQIKLFISCPGDITNEIDSINLAVKEINKINGKSNDFVIEIAHWNEDTYTQVGSDAQEVINEQIDYDVLVGIMWLKVGTPTKRDKSGTIEEINKALSNPNVEQLIYFKTTPPSDLKQINTKDLDEINSYKKDLSKRGVLYKEFNTIEKFESLFRINLSNLIQDKFINKKSELQTETHIPEIVSKKKNQSYSEIVELLNLVENTENESIEVDVFELQEGALLNLEFVTNSLHSITDSTNILSENLIKRTKEIDILNNIKDDRLRTKKLKTIANLISKELDEFNDRVNNEIPVFAENLISVGNTLSDWILVSNAYDKDDSYGLQKNASEFRDSMQAGMEGTANLLREIMNWPPVNYSFNKSKRETEITLKNLTKEIMDGLLLMDEALKN